MLSWVLWALAKISILEKNDTTRPFSKIQNPGQSTHLSVDMTAVLKRKSDKDFLRSGSHPRYIINPIIQFEQFSAQIIGPTQCLLLAPTKKKMHRRQ